jgi:CRP-like cAMP-binding protein
MPTPEQFVKMAERVPLFNGLRPGDIAKIIAKGMTLKVEKGNTLFYKGTVGNQMYVILGGKISLFDGSKHLADLRAGEMFGEMALISREPRSASAIAAEDSHLYVLSEQLFMRLMEKKVSITILLNIVGTLGNRLRDMNKKLSDMKSRMPEA